MNDATTDLRTVFRWWSAYPDRNIGINCEKSGLVVIDVDPRHGGDDALHQLRLELPQLNPSVHALSGGGGEHHIFLAEPDVVYRREITPGVDIKHRGYIVAPPSVHPDGPAYEWSVDGDPHWQQVASLPGAWTQRMVVGPARKVAPKLKFSTDRLRTIQAADYVETLTGRDCSTGWVQCPFHKGGNERTPSMNVCGTVWACYACDPPPGKNTMGGNIYDFAGMLRGYPIPLRGSDFYEVKCALEAACR
jgi:hypothetical protein